jgi:hypothetical protein
MSVCLSVLSHGPSVDLGCRPNDFLDHGKTSQACPCPTLISLCCCRIKEVEGSCTVDVRSASRVGKGDMGCNANRIRAFLKALNDRMAS